MSLLNKKGAATPPLLIQFALILVNVHFAVIVAVVATGAVQVTADQIVSVIAVRDAVVSAICAVLVSFVVRCTVVRWRAG